MANDLFVVTSELQEREGRIERAERDGYLVRGQELAAIRDGGLYRDRHQTFEDYCDERWELKKRRPYQLIDAAAFAKKCTMVHVPVPARERHIRPLLERLQSDEDRIAVWLDVLGTMNGARLKTQDIENAINRFFALRNKEYVTLSEWHEISETERPALLNRIGKKGLNRQDNKDIEWADWSWNPVTGCLHGCPYCYARDIAFSIYPEEVGFLPTLWPDRLTAPFNQAVPNLATELVAQKNIFTCSMADLFGRWVPKEWIQKVLSVAAANPQWNFLFLTKFPKRMAEFDLPANAWMGTTVDLQARVANAERAFEKVKAGVRWLSIEPMLEPLKFSRLDMFDWVVIGGASPSKKTPDGYPETPAWNIPIDWIADVHRQARAAGCAVYYKTNSGLAGLTRLREYPGIDRVTTGAPTVFDYLRAIPKEERVG